MSLAKRLLSIIESTEFTDKSEWKAAAKAKGAVSFEVMPDGDIKAWTSDGKAKGMWSADENKGYVY